MWEMISNRRQGRRVINIDNRVKAVIFVTTTYLILKTTLPYRKLLNPVRLILMGRHYQIDNVLSDTKLQCKIKWVKSENGNLHADSIYSLSKWKCYFSQLLNLMRLMFQVDLNARSWVVSISAQIHLALKLLLEIFKISYMVPAVLFVIIRTLNRQNTNLLFKHQHCLLSYMFQPLKVIILTAEQLWRSHK